MVHSPDSVTTQVRIACDTWEMRLQFTVPAGPTPLRQLIPLTQVLTDRVVECASSYDEHQGHRVSCRKGCGACCRQLVPITETEARRIAELVEELPEPRRSAVRARFAAARQRLADAGLLDSLLHPEQWPGPGEAERWARYFRLGIACPFLEEEACSIHPDRPLSCREYLVTSPAEHCGDPSPETVRRVPLPMEVWPAVARLDGPADNPDYLRWVPLVVAPEWAVAHPSEPPPLPGLQWLQELMHYLAGKDAPATPGRAGDASSRHPSRSERNPA